MTFWKFIGGILEVELVSAEPECALSAINAQGIELYQVRCERPLTSRFFIQRSEYPALSRLCSKRGDALKILGRKGLYYFAVRLTKRKLLLLGTCLFLCGAFFLPTRVFFVRVEGNDAVPSNLILNAAEESGICFGASRKAVRSERVKNALLDTVPQLQWAGVNTVGCTAVISVRERAKKPEQPKITPIASIVAARDGYVLSTVVTQGTGQVQPGQAVKAGEILISGYTDCGICIQATCAKGEILAQTHRALEAVTPSEAVFRDGFQGVRRRYSLRLGKKRIFFWKDSGIWDSSCGRMYKEYCLTLPGGFRLPAALCVDAYSRYGTQPGEIPKAEAERGLQKFAGQYLLRQMVAGQIQNSRQTVTKHNGVYRLQGSYVCTEMIGKVKQEQIGDTNGKASGEDR